MIDTSHFFRFNENKLEVFVTGLSLTFTRSIKEGHESISDVWNNRITWVCDRFKEFQDNNDISNVSIILDCRMENIYVARLGLELVKRFDLPKDKVKFLISVSTKGELDSFDYTIDRLAEINYCNYLDDLLDENIDWENITIDYPIMSLAARASKNRVIFTKELLDFFGDKCRVSLGINKHYELPKNDIRSYIETMKPYPFPYTQGTDNAMLETIHLLHVPPGYQLYKSLVNVIHDTNDNEHGYVIVSEKTFKSFAWHQIPIFVSTPGHAAAVRELGFDLFDDIFDHSYDLGNSPGPIHRLKIHSQLSKFLKKYPTVEAVNDLRKELYPRLASNYQLLLKLKEKRIIAPWPYYN